MHARLMRWLCCPRCEGELEAAASVSDCDGGIVEGTITCTSCGHVYPIVRGVPRFVATDQYTNAFSYEWLLHRRTQFGPSSGSDVEFVQKTACRPEELRDRVVLDAGCGTGRFSEVVADHAAEVIALDLSYAVETAQENIGHRPNVHVVQASITELPFKPETFDFIFSIGVLHHTPDTRAAFLALTRKLRPDGEIAVWLYDGSDRTWYVGSDLLRRFTTRIAPDRLYTLCRLSVPLYHLYRWTRLAPIFNRIVKIGMHPDPEWRTLDTFDWYAPRYQHRHTYEEVYGWFSAAGIERVAIGDIPVAVRGSLASGAARQARRTDRRRKRTASSRNIA